jgi:hypothetical protein
MWKVKLHNKSTSNGTDSSLICSGPSLPHFFDVGNYAPLLNVARVPFFWGRDVTLRLVTLEMRMCYTVVNKTATIIWLNQNFESQSFTSLQLANIPQWDACTASFSYKGQVNLSLCFFNPAPSHEGVLWSGGRAPRILFDLDTRWRWVVSFTPRFQFLYLENDEWYKIFKLTYKFSTLRFTTITNFSLNKRNCSFCCVVLLPWCSEWPRNPFSL